MWTLYIIERFNICELLGLNPDMLLKYFISILIEVLYSEYRKERKKIMGSRNSNSFNEKSKVMNRNE